MTTKTKKLNVTLDSYDAILNLTKLDIIKLSQRFLNETLSIYGPGRRKDILQ